MLRRTLLVKDLQGDLLAMISTHASSVLKEKCEALLSEFQHLFGDSLFPVDTANDPVFQFLAFHFTWYNRYHENVSLDVYFWLSIFLIWH